jgi:GNAT superfamily N-acetyltransferase
LRISYEIGFFFFKQKTAYEMLDGDWSSDVCSSDLPQLGRLFVLRVDNQVAGMANALITVRTAQGTRVLLLEDVIVSARFRAAGLGRQLVEHVCAWAKAEGMTRVTLLADQDNTKALAFYDRLGFEKSAMVVRRKPIS